MDKNKKSKYCSIQKTNSKSEKYQYVKCHHPKIHNSMLLTCIASVYHHARGKYITGTISTRTITNNNSTCKLYTLRPTNSCVITS